MNFLQMVQEMNNPNQFVQKMMGNTRIMQNPIAKNTLEMMNSGDMDGIKALAMNLCKERGLNPEDAVQQLKKQLGL